MKVTRSSVRRSKYFNNNVGDCVSEELSSEIDFKKEEMMANVGSNTRMQRMCNVDKRVTCGWTEMSCSQQVAKCGIDHLIESVNDVDLVHEVDKMDESEYGYRNCDRKTVIGEKRMREYEEECKSIRRRTIEQEALQSTKGHSEREARGCEMKAAASSSSSS